VRAACQTVGALSLTGGMLNSSCEPCPICHTVAIAAEIERIVYAAPKEWADSVGLALSSRSRPCRLPSGWRWRCTICSRCRTRRSAELHEDADQQLTIATGLRLSPDGSTLADHSG
jgi:tRNA(Arg) A34 adenosine deaminase TadA